MNLFVLWFVGWLPPPSASAVFASFHQNNFHFISIVFLPFSNRPSNHFSSRNGLWPGARSPSAFTIQSICPFGRADWNELLNCWMGRAVAVSIAIPFIIPFKNSKFFHSMNMQQLYWRQITVIISISFNQSLLSFQSTKQNNQTFLIELLVDEWKREVDEIELLFLFFSSWRKEVYGRWPRRPPNPTHKQFHNQPPLNGWLMELFGVLAAPVLPAWCAVPFINSIAALASFMNK